MVALALSMPGDGVQIRPATAADAEAILRAHLASIQGLCANDYTREEIAAWTGPKRAEWYTRAIEKGHGELLVATMDEEIVGFGDLGGDEIFGLYVHPQHVGRGLGKRLLEALEAEAQTSRRYEAEAQLHPQRQALLSIPRLPCDRRLHAFGRSQHQAPLRDDGEGDLATDGARMHTDGRSDCTAVARALRKVMCNATVFRIA